MRHSSTKRRFSEVSIPVQAMAASAAMRVAALIPVIVALWLGVLWALAGAES